MKKLMLMLVILVLCFGLCACGEDSKNDETQKAEEVKTEEKKEDLYGLEDGEYTVLDVHELFAHSHYSEYRELGLVLLDASGNRTYVRIKDTYEDNDVFDTLLTVLEGDVIKYKDGEFTIQKK